MTTILHKNKRPFTSFTCKRKTNLKNLGLIIASQFFTYLYCYMYLYYALITAQSEKNQDQFMVRKMWHNWQWNKWWFNIFKENHFWGIRYLHLAMILSTKPICIRKKMKSFKCETYQERRNHCIQRYFAVHCRWKLATWKAWESTCRDNLFQTALNI